MKATKVILVGLLAGVSAGALLGVLLTSGKGSETRKRLMDKGEDLAEGIKDKFNAGVDGVKSKSNDLHQKVDAKFAKGKETFKESNKDAKHTVM
jgi:gas vesicle protein